MRCCRCVHCFAPEVHHCLRVRDFKIIGVCLDCFVLVDAVSYRWADFEPNGIEVHADACETCGHRGTRGWVTQRDIACLAIVWVDFVAKASDTDMDAIKHAKDVYVKCNRRVYLIPPGDTLPTPETRRRLERQNSQSLWTFYDDIRPLMRIFHAVVVIGVSVLFGFRVLGGSRGDNQFWLGSLGSVVALAVVWPLSEFAFWIFSQRLWFRRNRQQSGERGEICRQDPNLGWTMEHMNRFWLALENYYRPVDVYIHNGTEQRLPLNFHILPVIDSQPNALTPEDYWDFANGKECKDHADKLAVMECLFGDSTHPADLMDGHLFPPRGPSWFRRYVFDKPDDGIRVADHPSYHRRLADFCCPRPTNKANCRVVSKKGSPDQLYLAVNSPTATFFPDNDATATRRFWRFYLLHQIGTPLPNRRLLRVAESASAEKPDVILNHSRWLVVQPGPDDYLT